MNLIRTNRAGNIPRHLLAIVGILLILLSSCPIKFNIRSSLANIPFKTAQSTGGTKANLYTGNGQANCTKCAAIETAVVQSGTSSLVKNLLPVAISTAIIASLLSISFNTEKTYLRFSNNHQIRGPIPIYLQHRKLII